MTTEDLYNEIRAKGSFLCVGLDTDITKVPTHLRVEADKVLAFNKAIVDATAQYTVAYKLNLAFYEAAPDGLRSYERTVAYIHKKYPNILVIADAKRGDIGNTSEMYAKAFFPEMGTKKKRSETPAEAPGSILYSRRAADAVTLSPYMGYDTVAPFLKYEGRWAVILALTSNPSASNFELQRLENGKYLFEQVLETAASWGTPENTMFVVGATQASMLADVRRIVPDHFLLIPGVGAQGGSLAEVVKYGMNSRCGLLVNSSRGIIYADNGERFAQAAAEEARKLQQEMRTYLISL